VSEDPPSVEEAPESQELPAWMGDVDPGRIGFPFLVDKRRYTKRVGLVYKETGRGALELDAYCPRDVERPPLVVMIHGGSWHRGGRYEMGLTRWAGYLASAGLAVVSIDYRLAPETTYPDSFQDVVDAVDWCVEQAAELGADAERIGLWGDSAGGHLALLLASSQTRPDFSGPRLRSGAERLRAVVAWYPPTDLRDLHDLASRGVAGSGMVRGFLGSDPDEDPARWREASPLEQAHANAPPALLLQGTRDILVPHWHTERYAERLAELGASHELHIVDGGVHGFERVGPGDEAKALIERSRGFLRAQLDVAEEPSA
jgi:acetyl esterase/lipase